MADILQGRYGSRTSSLEAAESATNIEYTHLDSIQSFLAQIFNKCPVAELIRFRQTIAVVPTGDGFPVYVTDLGEDGLLLGFGGWHEDGLPRSDVISLLESALSGGVRVTDYYMNGRPWRHVAEVREKDGRWRNIGEIGFFRFSLLRRVVTTVTRCYPTNRMART